MVAEGWEFGARGTVQYLPRRDRIFESGLLKIR
jgi:hypothetical protein